MIAAGDEGGRGSLVRNEEREEWVRRPASSERES